MNCTKCGGLWFEDAEDSRCLNCGSRDTTKPQALTAKEIMETIKKKRGRKPGSKNKPKDIPSVQSATPRTTVVQPAPEPPKPQTNGTHHAIDEHHPFVQVLAAKWEELDQQIEILRDKQAFLKELMDQAHITI